MVSSLWWVALLSCGSPETEAPPIPASDPVEKSQTETLRPPTRSTPSASPLAETDPALTNAISTLERIVDVHATDPDNPWAIGHGLLARGKTLKLQNGELAVDHLFATYAERFTAGTDTLLRFPEKSGQTRVEPHADLLLKALTEAGVSPERTVNVDGHTHTIADLYKGSLATTWLVPTSNHSSFSTPNDIPWSLQALTAWAPPDLKWTAVDGTQMTLDALTAFTAIVLDQETRFLRSAMLADGTLEKRGQGIFKYTCGGQHLIQGVSHAAARGYGGTDTTRIVREQATLLSWRFPRELAQLDAAAAERPEMALRLHVQRLKLSGHTLETLHKLSATGLLPDELKPQLRQIAIEVVRSVQNLQARGVFDRMDEVKAGDEQLYLDVIGDACHALRGLKLATGSSGLYVD